MNEFDFEELYLKALMNANKPQDQPNWVHAYNHGAGSTKAYAICEHFGVDPEGTVFRIAKRVKG